MDGYRLVRPGRLAGTLPLVGLALLAALLTGCSGGSRPNAAA
ncbi:MAG: hypothetical protein FD129_987, partial [bacterium]